MKVVAILVMLVMLVLANINGVDSQSLYACWGGCYNKCFIGNGKAAAAQYSEKLGCDYVCLNSCIPSTAAAAADFKYYCKIGCSLKRCIPVTADGARLDECFGWCNDLCNGSLYP